MAGEWDVVSEQPIRAGADPWAVVDEKPLRKLGALETAGRFGRSALEAANAYAAAPVLGVTTIADKLFGSDLTNRLADRFVVPSLERMNRAGLQPGETAGTAGDIALRVAPELGKTVPDLAMGGGLVTAAPKAAITAATPVARVVADTLTRGGYAGLPAGFRSGVERQQELVDAGVDATTAGVQGAVRGALTTGQFALPASAGSAAATLPARVVSRGAQGAALNTAAGAVQRQAENIILPEQAARLRQDITDPAALATDTVLGALFGQMGGRIRPGGDLSARATYPEPAPGVPQIIADATVPARGTVADSISQVTGAPRMADTPQARADAIRAEAATRGQRQADVEAAFGPVLGREADVYPDQLGRAPASMEERAARAAQGIGETPESIASAFERARRQPDVGRTERSNLPDLPDAELERVAAAHGTTADAIRELGPHSQRRLLAKLMESEAANEARAPQEPLVATAPKSEDIAGGYSPPSRPMPPGDRAQQPHLSESRTQQFSESGPRPVDPAAVRKRSADIEALDQARGQLDALRNSEAWTNLSRKADLNERMTEQEAKQWTKLRTQHDKLSESVFKLEGKIYAAEEFTHAGSQMGAGTSDRPFRNKSSSLDAEQLRGQEERIRAEADAETKRRIDELEAEWRARQAQREQARTNEAKQGDYRNAERSQNAAFDGNTARTDAGGFVMSDKGAPVWFKHQRDAGWWILRTGNKQAPHQTFEIANHPGGEGFTVRETARSEPPPRGGGENLPAVRTEAANAERVRSDQGPTGEGGGGGQPRVQPRAEPRSGDLQLETPRQPDVGAAGRPGDAGRGAGRAEAPAQPLGPKPKASSLLGAIIKAGGINPRELRDLTGEGRTGTSGVPVGLFRAPGMDRAGGPKSRGFGLDELVVRLREEGFNIPDDKVDGGVGALRDMIRAEIMDERTHGRGAEDLAAYQEARRAADEQARYQQDPEYRAEQDRLAAEDRAREQQAAAAREKAQADAIAEARAEREAMQWEGEQVARSADDIDAVNRRLQEIASETRGSEDPAYPNPENKGQGAERGLQDDVQARGNEPGGPAEVAGRVDEARGSDTPAERGDVSSERAGDGRPELNLENPTEAGLRAADDRRAREQQQRARVEAAPRPEEFTLTGSNRAADEAAARGQQELPGTETGRGTTLFSGPPIMEMLRFAGEVGERFTGPMREWKNAALKVRDAAVAVRDALAAMRKNEKAGGESVAGAIARSMFYNVHSHIKSFGESWNSPTIGKIADMIYSSAGKEQAGQSAHEAMSAHVTHGQREISALANDIEKLRAAGVTEAQIIRQVENPGERRGAAGALAKRIADFFEAEHAYQKEAGADLGKVSNYYPRQYDKAAIIPRKADFVADATRAYMRDGLSERDAADAADAFWYRSAYGSEGSPDYRPTGGKESFTKARELSPQAAELLRRWRVDGIADTMNAYLMRSTRRAEIARRFGDGWSRWDGLEREIIKESPDITPEALRELRAMTASAMGLRAQSMGVAAHVGSQYLRMWTTLATMPKAALSSIAETFIPLARANGDMAVAVQHLRNVLYENSKSLLSQALTGKRTDAQQRLYDFAEDIGALSQSPLSHMMADRWMGGDVTSKNVNAITSKFFRLNLLEQMTTWQKALSVDASRIWLRRLAKNATGEQTGLTGGEKSAAFYLKELGVPEAKIKGFSEFVKQLGDGLPDAGQLQGEYGTMYRNAMNRFTRQSIQEPGAATRPAWANTDWGSVVFQLQGFANAFHKNVLLRQANLLKEGAKGDYTAAERAALMGGMIPSLMLSAATAGLVWEIRDRLYNKQPKERTTQAKVERAISAAGLTGAVDPYLQMVGGLRYNRSPAAAAGGPSFGAVDAGVEALGRLVLNNSEKTNAAERKAADAFYTWAIEPAATLLLAGTPAPVSPATQALTILAIPASKQAFIDAAAGEKASRKEKPIRGIFEPKGN